MLTRVEIDGFKTFRDFSVDLAPFQVIVGPNGSGKSNLFDALHLLSRLVDTNLRSAFLELRGDANELFTILPGDKLVDKIRFAVEMLLDRRVEDDFGQQVELTYTRLRYELEVAFHADVNGLESPYILYEALKTIPREQDKWVEKYLQASSVYWLPPDTAKQVNFISTFFVDPMPGVEHLNLMIALQPDQGKGTGAIYPAEKAQRTVLSSVTTISLPHAFAAHKELLSLRFLLLNPDVLREPSAVRATPFLSREGGNMPTMLHRMQLEDPFALRGVSLDMANLVPEISSIAIEKDQGRDEYVVRAETTDQRVFSARVLSDGTLRLLALATLRNDPQLKGILCIEEPENGVNPMYLKKIARLLCEMVTDFADPEQMNVPLRQLLVTTHSPLFISQPDVINSLLFATMPVRVEPQATGNPSLLVTRMIPVITSEDVSDTPVSSSLEAYTLDQVIDYLSSERIDATVHRLHTVRAKLSERRMNG